MEVHKLERELVNPDVVALVEQLIRALVDFPDQVRVSTVSGRQAVILEVAVHPEDVRRIIGKKGRTAEALREILVNLGSKEGRRYLMEIVEPEGRRPRPLHD